MKRQAINWGWLLDLGEDLALELAEAAIRERKRQKSGQRRLK
jgi:hypothetical protein